jgi:hypothetical protein
VTATVNTVITGHHWHVTQWFQVPVEPVHVVSPNGKMCLVIPLVVAQNGKMCSVIPLVEESRMVPLVVAPNCKIVGGSACLIPGVPAVPVPVVAAVVIRLGK